MAALYIDDGRTATKSVPARPGQFPGFTVAYRRALSRERHGYAAAGEAKDARRLADFEADLVARHVVTLDGDPLPKDRAARLHPDVLDLLVSLVLSYSPEDEAAEGNG